MTTYAITGATGPFGRAVLDTLLARGTAPGDVVAVVRTPAKAADLLRTGVQVREGSYDRPETIEAALAGVDRLLLVSGNEVGRRVPQHTNVVEAAVRAGVGRMAYTSVLRASETNLVIAPEHKATEEVVRESGLPYSFLRNGWYTENYTAQLGQYLATGVIRHAAGEGRIAAAPRAELAEAAAIALVEDVGPATVHELAGPAFTYADLAAVLAEVTGTGVVAQALSPDALVESLTAAGVDAQTAGFLVALDRDIADGALDGSPEDLMRLLGRAPTGIADAVRAALG